MREERESEDRVVRGLAIGVAVLLLLLAAGAAVWSCVLERRYPPPVFHGVLAANSEPGGGVGR